jgi:hypothetical protein
LKVADVPHRCIETFWVDFIFKFNVPHRVYRV